jgi:predicted enzyme related to lactoylglutathione lyase
MPHLELVLDCTEPDRAARFWVAALGYRLYGAAANYRSLVPPVGETGPKLILQGVREPKTVKNRMHLDLQAADIDAEVARLVALGATRATDRIVEHGTSWVVLQDPDGNEFCVCQLES